MLVGVCLFLSFVCCPLAFYICIYRNQKVYEYSRSLLDKVSIACKQDIDLGLDWEWRYRELNAISYNKMVWEFWKPLKSFYPNLRFTQPVRIPIVGDYRTVEDQLNLEKSMESIPRRSYHSVH